MQVSDWWRLVCSGWGLGRGWWSYVFGCCWDIIYWTIIHPTRNSLVGHHLPNTS